MPPMDQEGRRAEAPPTRQRTFGFLDHVALWQELEDLLGCKVDVVSEKALHRLIRQQVLEEAVPL